MKATVFEQKQQHQSRRTPVTCRAPMFANRAVKLKVSWYALDLAYKQYQQAVHAYRYGLELSRCEGSFGRQYGLPCRHQFHKRLMAVARSDGTCDVHVRPGEALELRDFDRHWWLQVDLTEIDPLLLIGDFEVTKKEPRKPRKPRNQPASVVPRWIRAPGVSSSYNQLANGKRRPCWWESRLREGAADPARAERLSQPPPLPVLTNPADTEWYEEIQSSRSPTPVPPVPSPTVIIASEAAAPLVATPVAPTAPATPVAPAAPAPAAPAAPIYRGGGQKIRSWKPFDPSKLAPRGRYHGP
ncbi:hypothetical protein F5X98DRAFT_360072 [Xylaria grammica]|nr:hypothetical protein F5X98DRAFT_360072 [Xylaria grammica]